MKRPVGPPPPASVLLQSEQHRPAELCVALSATQTRRHSRCYKSDNAEPLKAIPFTELGARALFTAELAANVSGETNPNTVMKFMWSFSGRISDVSHVVLTSIAPPMNCECFLLILGTPPFFSCFLFLASLFMQLIEAAEPSSRKDNARRKIKSERSASSL